MQDYEGYDAVVVGGGVAGLSGALVLGRCVRRVLVCDSGRYRNASSRALHCYLGHDGIPPADLLARSLRQLERYQTVTVLHGEVGALSRSGEDFHVHIEGRDPVHARALLVATGVVDELPRIEGIAGLWGKSVHVCPYCDGWEHRDAPVAVYGRGSKGAGLALLLRQWTGDLVLLTDGAHDVPPDVLQRLGARGIRLEMAGVARLEGSEGRLRCVHLSDGRRIQRQALFFNTGQHPRSPLLESVGCTFADNGGVVCDSEGRTNVEGVYVAGDVSRDVQLAVVAASEGARAALAINNDLLRRNGHF